MKKNTNTKNVKYHEVNPPCHRGPIEIHPGLWLGDQDEGELALKRGLATIAVPLNKMSGSVWSDWDGEIIYVPITDYSVLPEKIAARKAQELAERIKNGESISLFCFGGHGRTGYMAALILGVLGYKDPISFIRKNYCEEAIESEEQIIQIAELLGSPELKRHKPAKFYELYQIGYEDNSSKCYACCFFALCGMEEIDGNECEYYNKKGGAQE